MKKWGIMKLIKEGIGLLHTCHFVFDQPRPMTGRNVEAQENGRVDSINSKAEVCEGIGNET